MIKDDVPVFLTRVCLAALVGAAFGALFGLLMWMMGHGGPSNVLRDARLMGLCSMPLGAVVVWRHLSYGKATALWSSLGAAFFAQRIWLACHTGHGGAYELRYFAIMMGVPILATFPWVGATFVKLLTLWPPSERTAVTAYRPLTDLS